MNQQRQRRIAIRAENIIQRRQFQTEIPILGDGQKYTIGSSNGNQHYVHLPFAVSLSGKQFELDSSQLLIPRNNSEFLNQTGQVLQGLNIQQNIITKIGEFTITPKQKLKLKDISGRLGYPSLINISRQCENQELIRGNVFIIGKKSKLKVLQNNQLFGDFLENPQLFEITKNAKVVGLGSGMDALFKLSFERRIAEVLFFQTLNSDQLKKEFEEFYSKSCMYIKVQEPSQNQSYLLVENSKRTSSLKNLNDAFLLKRRSKSLPVGISRNVLSVNNSRSSSNLFSIGRDQDSDIVFKDQSVSSRHGMIQYLHKTKKWIIFDGQWKVQQLKQLENRSQWRESLEWKDSSNRTWLEMIQDKEYYLDKSQVIKVDDIEITMNWT